jgi:hypothetical protein
MPRTKGSKNKSKSKIINKNKNTNINNVHVHVEKTKTRRRRTTKPREELHSNPLSNTIGISRPSSQNLGFHPRGLIDNSPQQPTIINIQPSADLEKLQKKLKKYKDKLNQTKEAQDTVNKEILTNMTSTPQPKQAPINVTVNPFQPTVKQEKVITKKSIVRFPKSKTKAGTIFKPSELDETMSTPSATPQKPPEPDEDPEEEEKRTKEEKKIETRYYTLVGNAQKGGSIVTAQIALDKLKERLQPNLNERQRNKLKTSISKQDEKIKELQFELKEVELKLKNIRASKPRQRGGLLSAVTSLFSPAKTK